MRLDDVLGRMTAGSMTRLRLTAGEPAEGVTGRGSAVRPGIPAMTQRALLSALYPLATPERWHSFITSQDEAEAGLTLAERSSLYTRRVLTAHRVSGDSLFRITLTRSGKNLRADIRLMPDT